MGLGVRVSVEGSPPGLLLDPPLDLEVWAWSPGGEPSGPWANAVLASPGEVALDLTNLVVALASGYVEGPVLLRARQESFARVPDLAVALGTPRALLEGKERPPAVEVVLRRATVVRGRVADAGGEAVLPVRVGIYAVGPDGPAPGAIDESTADEEGRFAVRAAGPGRYLVVGTSTWAGDVPEEDAPRGAPAWAIVELRAGAPLGDVRLDLLPAGSVRGRVLVGSVPPPPGPGEGAVAWALERPARLLDPPFWAEGPRAGWADGAVHWVAGTARVDGDGTFEVRGLAALPYRLEVTDCPGANLHRCAPDRPVRRVVPPVDDVLFDLRLARLGISLTSGGEPVRAQEVDVSDVGMDGEAGGFTTLWDTRSLCTDDSGRASLLVSPHGLYSVSVLADGHEPFFLDVEAPAAGETIEAGCALEPHRARPGLAVVLEGPGAGTVTVASFGFQEPDGDPRERTEWPVLSRVERGADGAFHLPGLEVAGRLRLRVRPGRDWWADEGEWADAVVDVDVPPSGEGGVAVGIARGGRLVLEARDEEGRPVEAGLTLLDPDGREVPARFVARTGEGRVVTTHALPPAAPAWVESVLPPGTYAVLLEEEGFLPERRLVVLEAGKTAVLRFLLRRP